MCDSTIKDINVQRRHHQTFKTQAGALTNEAALCVIIHTTYIQYIHTGLQVNHQSLMMVEDC